MQALFAVPLDSKIKSRNPMQKGEQKKRQVSPKFSLVLCTINRKEEVDKFLQSLSRQTLSEFEVIIVDQNKDSLLDPVIAKWRKLLIIEHVKVDFRGLSKARNFGMKYIKEGLIAFPDDDCEYQPSTLENTYTFMCQNPKASIVIGKQSSKICHANENIATEIEEIRSPLNIFKSKAISFTIFARFSDISQLGPVFFDEKLGVGAGTKWGSGEETDFLIRAHRLGITIFKQPAIEICHPVKISSPRRCLHYGLGRYKVIKKNDLSWSIYAINVLQPLARLFLKSEYRFLLSHICTALGRSGLPLLLNNFWIR